jgi:hypothetical protein
MNPWLEFVADDNDVVIASCGGQIVHAGDNSPFGAGRVRYILFTHNRQSDMTHIINL